MSDQFKVVISDCHLSAGRYFEGKYNPHEDFFFDQEMIEFFEFFSTGLYGDGADGPVNVELVINGDYLDFLNVPYLGEFEEGISEEIALTKLEAIIAGHSRVMDALRKFAGKPNKKITYLVGNHDAELFFEKVRERITRLWDPEGQYPSEKVSIVIHTDRLDYEGGLQIRHGNQYEASNQLDFERPFLQLPNGKHVLNIPWGSIYVLKIINRLKWERANLDKIRPIKVFAVLGMIFDPIFTVRYLFLSMFYFLKTRIFGRMQSKFRLRNTFRMISQEGAFFQDLEREARELLNHHPEVHTIVFGHTHLPMHRVYENGRQYLNSGTWTKMVYLDYRFIAEPVRKTFILIHLKNGEIKAELNQWVGQKMPFQAYLG
jgi:UDP-2,3-diacylglucosamine pyrophosphatase LpxH